MRINAPAALLLHAADRIARRVAVSARSGAKVTKGDALVSVEAAGAPDSPHNMIEVVLRVALTAPGLYQGWDAEVKLSRARRVSARPRAL